MEFLRTLPLVGGMKFCCGGFVRGQFGEREAAIKGRHLLQELKRIGAEKVVTFCPECDHMISESYPSIIPEFDIAAESIAAYLLEKQHNNDIVFTHPIDQKVAFHDPCAWRKMDTIFHENPRKLLRAMGAEVVEMKHNFRESLCCGAPMLGRNPKLAADIADRRVMEAKESGAQTIVVGCTGCFALSEKAQEHGLGIYHITEMAQMAMGEKPLHRIDEIKSQLSNNIFKTITENPNILKQRYIIQDGELKPVDYD